MICRLHFPPRVLSKFCLSIDGCFSIYQSSLISLIARSTRIEVIEVLKPCTGSRSNFSLISSLFEFFKCRYRTVQGWGFLKSEEYRCTERNWLQLQVTNRFIQPRWVQVKCQIEELDVGKESSGGPVCPLVRPKFYHRHLPRRRVVGGYLVGSQPKGTRLGGVRMAGQKGPPVLLIKLPVISSSRVEFGWFLLSFVVAVKMAFVKHLLWWFSTFIPLNIHLFAWSTTRAFILFSYFVYYQRPIFSWKLYIITKYILYSIIWYI